MSSFRILVASDLHMHQRKPSDLDAPSYLSARPEYQGAKVNPIEGIAALFEGREQDIDWLICAGDIGDKSDSVSASLAWRQLEEVRKRLHIRRLIGTVGNHDIDSRRQEGEQKPEQVLKELRPLFPISDRRIAESFWANDFAIWQDRRASATLVLINSCGLHGIAVPDGNEAEHGRGRVTEAVLRRVERELERKMSRFNLLVMHHHIRQHPWRPYDVSHAVNGPELVEVLKSTGRPWLVIHGHNHMPDLSYSDGSALAPVVLSAGSLSSRRLEQISGRTPRNQLYLVDFDGGEGDAVHLRARVFAWNWTPHVGWVEASRDSGLPRQSGFGIRGDMTEIATRIETALQQSRNGRLRWNELVLSVPEVQFLLNHQVEQLLGELKRLKVMVDFDECQCPSVFERQQR